MNAGTRPMRQINWAGEVRAACKLMHDMYPDLHQAPEVVIRLLARLQPLIQERPSGQMDGFEG
jgi:hypothetical protein